MYVLGLDAGGTKTELLARDLSTGAEQRHFGPAANVQRVGVERAADILASLIREAAQGATEPVSAFAGVAGAGREEDQHALQQALRSRLPASIAFGVTHDADIALEGAFLGKSGVVVIAGTGSVVVGRTHAGTVERAGGWGHLIGDEGSGNAIGVEALRLLTAAFDGAPWTPLTEQLRDGLGLTDGPTLIRRVYREAWPVQRAAPVVCAAAGAGDAVAGDLLDRQAALLARQVGLLISRFPDALFPRVAFLGGLLREQAYAERLQQAIARAVPDAEFVAPQTTPVEGAWRRARHLVPAP